MSNLWKSVNQDVYKSRQKTMEAAEEIMVNQLREQFSMIQSRKNNSTLLAISGSGSNTISNSKTVQTFGKHIIIDRCNFDVTQRATWIQLARKYQYTCISIVLPNYDNMDVCIARAYSRGNDGIHSGTENWTEICSRMCTQMKLPTYEEGFRWIHVSPSEEDLEKLTQFIITQA